MDGVIISREVLGDLLSRLEAHEWGHPGNIPNDIQSGLNLDATMQAARNVLEPNEESQHEAREQVTPGAGAVELVLTPIGDMETSYGQSFHVVSFSHKPEWNDAALISAIGQNGDVLTLNVQIPGLGSAESESPLLNSGELLYLERALTVYYRSICAKVAQVAHMDDTVEHMQATSYCYDLLLKLRAYRESNRAQKEERT